MMTTNTSLYTEYLIDIAFKKEIDAGCPAHSTDQLTEIFLCKIHKINPELLIFTTLSVNNIQDVRRLIEELRERYG